MKKLMRDDTEHGKEYYLASEVDALLSKQEQGEPVGTVGELFDEGVIWMRELDRDLLVYTTPQQRKPPTA